MPLELHFLDEKLDNLYKTENNLAKLITIFSLASIFIAIMGVYGLITFNSRYRAKEIAIRKVNGAEISSILYLLNKNVLIQFGVALLIAIPLSYYVVERWISQFAYRTSIHWWVFVLSGIIVLLITLLTVSIQSYRAAIKNPNDSLRSE